MYDYVQQLQKTEKLPFFITETAATGTITFNSATYALTSNAGVSVASGSVTSVTGSGTATVTADITIDAGALSLAAGIYILKMTLLTTGSDTRLRTRVVQFLLFVPGFITEHPIYPTAADLQVFLTHSEMLENPPTAAQKFLDLDGAVSAAVTEFEQKTNRVPFRSIGTDTTKTFANFFQGKVFFNADLISLSVDADAFSINGTNYVLDTNFSLYPQNAPNEGRPYTYALFYGTNFFFPETTLNPYFLYDANYPGVKLTILVKGIWGYALTVSHDVWTAILHRAAALIAPQLALSISGGLYEAKRLNYTLRYAGSSITPLSAEAKAWDAEFNRQVALYRRIRTTF